MLNYDVVTSAHQSTTGNWWQLLRSRLTFAYIAVALALLIMSGAGHARLLGQVGKVFGGFFWAIDTDGRIVVVSTPAELPPFEVPADSLTRNSRIIAINGRTGSNSFQQVYAQAHPGDKITYTILHNNTQVTTLTRPATLFTLNMWWQNYGLGLLAGISWLIVGGLLLSTSSNWSGAVEGLTLIPPALLFLLYSHWGNVQYSDHADAVFQLIWVPAFALLGAAFIQLSLNYRPEALEKERLPGFSVDLLPYIPLLGILIYEWISYFVLGGVPTRINIIVSLGYAAIGGALSLLIGLRSLLRITNVLPLRGIDTSGQPVKPVSARVRRRVGDLLTLWIGGISLGFCLSVLPILLTGQTLLPLPMFYVLVTVYPLILWYAIRSLRLVESLNIALEQKEDAYDKMQRTATELQRSNSELQRATSLLLHADAHLRSLLSQRIHDQPKQQALRIRSLLAHWQHKLRVEAERNGSEKVTVQPVIEALGKIRKISEELEGDLRGLQMLVEDAYQRRSLGLKLHLEKLIREDLPMLHPESPLKIQADLWALDNLRPDLEQTPEGARLAEAISYTITQALLNIYNHAGASFATVRTVYNDDTLDIFIMDDGHGFEIGNIPAEKTSLFKAQLKAREADGTITLTSFPYPQPNHGTAVLLHLPLPCNTKFEARTGNHHHPKEQGTGNAPGTQVNH